jgi:molecular chaperone DnaK (HSP70)
MNDWAEGHHTIKELTRQMYEAMLSGQFKKAMELCDQIVVEARITRAKIGAQNDK